MPANSANASNSGASTGSTATFFRNRVINGSRDDAGI
jgi:hypothetical protein